MQDLIKALQIFLKYKNEAYPTYCEHDVLSITGVTQEEVSKEDADALVDLGFYWADVNECWQSFYYGSA